MRMHNILLQTQFNLSKFCFVLYSIKEIVIHGLGITNLSFKVHPGKSRAFVQEYLPLPRGQEGMGRWSEIGQFVNVDYIKNVHGGRWVVKKEQNYVHVVIECPLCQAPKIT